MADAVDQTSVEFWFRFFVEHQEELEAKKRHVAAAAGQDQEPTGCPKAVQRTRRRMNCPAVTSATSCSFCCLRVPSM